jgi:hypothetical protein
MRHESSFGTTGPLGLKTSSHDQFQGLQPWLDKRLALWAAKQGHGPHGVLTGLNQRPLSKNMFGLHDNVISNEDRRFSGSMFTGRMFSGPRGQPFFQPGSKALENGVHRAFSGPTGRYSIFDLMADHSKHFFSKTRMLKVCTAFLGAEDHMQPDPSQRLWHESPYGMTGPLGLKTSSRDWSQGLRPWLEERLALWAVKRRQKPHGVLTGPNQRPLPKHIFGPHDNVVSNTDRSYSGPMSSVPMSSGPRGQPFIQPGSKALENVVQRASSGPTGRSFNPRRNVHQFQEIRPETSWLGGWPDC